MCRIDKKRAPCVFISILRLATMRFNPHCNKILLFPTNSTYYLCLCAGHHPFVASLYAPIGRQVLPSVVPTLSEENRKDLASQQGSTFCYYGYDSIMAGPALPWHIVKAKEMSSTSSPLLMELRAKGAFFTEKNPSATYCGK